MIFSTTGCCWRCQHQRGGSCQNPKCPCHRSDNAWIEEEAQKIIDRFFEASAAVRKMDFDFIRTALTKAHARGVEEGKKEGRRKEREELTALLESMEPEASNTEDKVTRVGMIKFITSRT